MGLRRFFRNQKDRDLVNANSIGTSNQLRVELNLRYHHEVPLGDYQEASDTMLEATVARAVARERTESLSGHNDLQRELRVSPKKEWRIFGKWIKGKRGVEG